MAPIYATADELAAYITGDPEAQAGADAAVYTLRIRSASRLVAKATESAVYATDGDLLPTDAGKLTAMSEATMEHASAWIAAGIDPALGVSQLTRGVKSKSLSGPGGTASVTYDADRAEEYAVLLAEGQELTPAAWAILEAAGLVSNRATVLGKGGRDTWLVGTAYDIGTGALKP